MKQKRRHFHREKVDKIKSDMRWPHKLEVVCTGRRTHKQAALVQMWMDKTTGEITVLGWAVSRNEHNVAPRRIEDRYRHSEGMYHVTCNRCNQTRSFRAVEFGRLLLETAWSNESAVDVSFADDLIPFAMQAAGDREKSTSTCSWAEGDWQKDSSIRPPWTAPTGAWRAHAEHLKLNVKGMSRWQIIQTHRYYYPEKSEAQAVERSKIFKWPDML